MHFSLFHPAHTALSESPELIQTPVGWTQSIAAAMRVAVETVRGWKDPLPEEVLFVGFDAGVVAALEKLVGPPSENRWNK
jgi:hypothetical protein